MALSNKRIGVFVEEGFEDLEFWVPVMRLREEGAIVVIIGTGRQTSFTGKHCLTVTPDINAAAVDPATLDAIVVPGGWAPDKLRRDEAVLNIVRALHHEDKIIAAICHGGWVLASAEVIEGRRVTGSRGIKDDMVHAGAIWQDVPALRDGHFVFGRVVKDIPSFCKFLVAALADG